MYTNHGYVGFDFIFIDKDDGAFSYSEMEHMVGGGCCKYNANCQGLFKKGRKLGVLMGAVAGSKGEV